MPCNRGQSAPLPCTSPLRDQSYPPTSASATRQLQTWGAASFHPVPLGLQRRCWRRRNLLQNMLYSIHGRRILGCQCPQLLNAAMFIIFSAHRLKRLSCHCCLRRRLCMVFGKSGSLGRVGRAPGSDPIWHALRCRQSPRRGHPTCSVNRPSPSPPLPWRGHSHASPASVQTARKQWLECRHAEVRHDRCIFYRHPTCVCVQRTTNQFCLQQRQARRQKDAATVSMTAVLK